MSIVIKAMYLVKLLGLYIDIDRYIPPRTYG